MGNALDRIGGYESPEQQQSSQIDDLTESSSSRGRKRKSGGKEAETSPSKKISKLDTAKYVYEKLFLKGEGSDIVLNALGKSWNLHKLYLQQCKYFEAIISGNWKESKAGVLNLDINDPNVTLEGLESVLASLYHNEIEIDMDKIEGTLSAACLLQLDSVILRCEENMIETLNVSNVLRFYEISMTYGLLKLENLARSCLLRAFWKFMKDVNMIKGLSEKLFITLLASSDLLIVEGELDLYRAVKLWIYVQENDEVDIDESTRNETMRRFFQTRPENEMFVKYSRLFAALRLHNILTLSTNMKILEDDRLFPRQLLTSMYADQWKNMIMNEEEPYAVNEITEDQFNVCAIRAGRQIDTIEKAWRWTGYNHGTDILININSYQHSYCSSLSIRRNYSTKTPYALNNKPNRMVHFRVRLCDSNDHQFFDSGKRKELLNPDQSKIVCQIPPGIILPISVHVQYLTISPPDPTFLYVNRFIYDNMIKNKPNEAQKIKEYLTK